MHALLRLGYEFDGERAVRLEKKLDGVELGWALGAGMVHKGMVVVVPHIHHGLYYQEHILIPFRE